MGAEFVAAMEQVLTVYSLPYNAKRPVVCLDEKVYYLLSTPHGKIAMRQNQNQGKSKSQNQSEKQDYEYARQGTANLFVVVEPLRGWRKVVVREQRTARDYAEVLKTLVDEVYPESEEIWLVQDNLNTHNESALYKRYKAEEAGRLMRKIRWIKTPKHGSWLNMAEIEISVFERQCLDRGLESMELLQQEVGALEAERNRAGAKIKWQFSCEQGRTVLHRLYPKIE